ncbi:PREDICTED: enhancer of split M1 protein-like [Rhagoletis zephyria]|uniref:enhancer of split M1 protein-like n=1 Tax=Rhagoletis zephyria TaxID=28612 RepID=UPI0008112E46|nr:PREDICTED: enhancer of split M1 protein-like [Rhagoletis zephyria]
MKIAATVVFFIILSAAKGEQSDGSEECTNACPKIFDPVCAVYDGVLGGKKESGSEAGGTAVYRYFHNDCLRRYASCSTGTVWRITSLSSCLQHIDPLLRQQCLRPCPFIYEPICASNGKVKEIFGNSCVLAVENCLSVDAWTVAEDSECGLDKL